MEKVFETYRFKGVTILFIKMGRDIAAITENGDHLGTYTSLDSAFKFIAAGEAEPLCKCELSYRKKS